LNASQLPERTEKSEEALRKLQHAAINQQNLFEVMMDAVKLFFRTDYQCFV
jgi:hypothetical protein